jgi:hypothetical protein
LDQNYISQEEFDECFELADITIRKATKLMEYLTKSNFKSEEFN